MGWFDPPAPNQIHGWICLLERNTELEAQMEANLLMDAGIPVQILSKRDSAYSLTIGEMSRVYLYVPEEQAEDAMKLLRDIEGEE